MLAPTFILSSLSVSDITDTAVSTMSPAASTTETQAPLPPVGPITCGRKRSKAQQVTVMMMMMMIVMMVMMMMTMIMMMMMMVMMMMMQVSGKKDSMTGCPMQQQGGFVRPDLTR